MIVNLIYGTEPLILHTPCLQCGGEPLWDNIPLTKSCELPEDLTIVTWSNRRRGSLLESQLNSLNIPHIVLARKKRPWKSNRVKIKTFCEVEIPTKYVLGLDADDVKIVCNLKPILERFEKHQCKILYAATSAFVPYDKDEFSNKFLEQFRAMPPFRYLNAGAFIGETQYAQEAYSTLDLNDPKFSTSEQYLVRKLYHERYPEIKVDEKSDIFQIGRLITEESIFDKVEIIGTYNPTRVSQ